MDKDTLRENFERQARGGSGAHAIACALFELTDAQRGVENALLRLGVGDAATHFGAIEVVSMELKRIADHLQTR